MEQSKEVTISNARYKKYKLAAQIADLITQYEEENVVFVSGIRIDHEGTLHTNGNTIHGLAQVHITVNL